MRAHLRRLLNELQKPDIWPLAARRLLLRWMGAEVGRGAMVLAGVDIVPGPLTLGAGAFVNRGCRLEATGGIAIGARVHLAYGVTILTTTHGPGQSDCRAGVSRSYRVVIGDGAWLGANATILPGVTIARGAVIAAGSVVVADTEPDTLYAGVPAVRKKALP
jgi:acetyltransferase-like isoleucine patch superfamily enzyme